MVFTTLISRELQNNSRECENPLKVIKDFNKKVQQYNKNVKEQMTERNYEIICVRISHPCELSCNNLHINAVWNGYSLRVFFFYSDKEIACLWENERSL